MLNTLSPILPFFFNACLFLQVSGHLSLPGKKDHLLLIAAVVILVFAISLIITIRFASRQKRANKCMEELEKTRERFFSIISHDLKGPFLGFSELLESLAISAKHLSQQELETNLRMLFELSRQMGLLLDNLLEWTKSMHNMDTYSPGTILLKDVIDQTTTMYLPLAQIKGIQLLTECPGELYVIADKNMILLVIRNLLDNAIRFAGHKGGVQISAREAGPDVVVSVEDTGPGIDPEVFNHLVNLHPFGDKQSGSKLQKHGLGLPLCVEFIRRWNGHFWVEPPEGEKRNSVLFTVKIQHEHE